MCKGLSSISRTRVRMPGPVAGSWSSEWLCLKGGGWHPEDDIPCCLLASTHTCTHVCYIYRSSTKENNCLKLTKIHGFGILWFICLPVSVVLLCQIHTIKQSGCCWKECSCKAEEEGPLIPDLFMYPTELCTVLQVPHRVVQSFSSTPQTIIVLHVSPQLGYSPACTPQSNTESFMCPTE